MMGTIKPSKDQASVTRYSKMDSKIKKKYKNPPDKKREKSKSQEEPLRSKKNIQKKKNEGEMSKFAYCGKGYHPKIPYMKKQIDMLTQLLRRITSPFVIAQRREKEDQI